MLVIGDIGVGKTSIIQQYVHGKYSQYYRATIGVDFALKVLKWNDDTLIRLQLWDVAGEKHFIIVEKTFSVALLMRLGDVLRQNRTQSECRLALVASSYMPPEHKPIYLMYSMYTIAYTVYEEGRTSWTLVLPQAYLLFGMR